MNTLIKKIAYGVAVSGALMVLLGSTVMPVDAAAPPANNPQSGSMGVSGVIGSAPPTRGATIATPTNGQSFTNTPIRVAGLCPTGLLVKIFSNNVFVGSVMCANGSYSIQIDLFSGRNDLVARVYDSLDQAGPDSNIVRVDFNDQQFSSSGNSSLILTSDFARRGANPKTQLVWPIILTGGTGPYAISIDWGDGKPSDLVSRQFAGSFDITHTYDQAGIYTITIKATDKDGLTAYLQLVGIANGAITSNASTTSDEPSIVTITKVIWLPAALLLPLILVAFWLGRKYELSSLKKRLARLNDQ
jgi:hypothetical protein